MTGKLSLDEESSTVTHTPSSRADSRSQSHADQEPCDLASVEVTLDSALHLHHPGDDSFELDDMPRTPDSMWTRDALCSIPPAFASQPFPQPSVYHPLEPPSTPYHMEPTTSPPVISPPMVQVPVFPPSSHWAGQPMCVFTRHGMTADGPGTFVTGDIIRSTDEIYPCGRTTPQIPTTLTEGGVIVGHTTSATYIPVGTSGHIARILAPSLVLVHFDGYGKALIGSVLGGQDHNLPLERIGDPALMQEPVYYPAPEWVALAADGCGSNMWKHLNADCFVPMAREPGPSFGIRPRWFEEGTLAHATAANAVLPVTDSRGPGELTSDLPWSHDGWVCECGWSNRPMNRGRVCGGNQRNSLCRSGSLPCGRPKPQLVLSSPDNAPALSLASHLVHATPKQKRRNQKKARPVVIGA